MSRVNEPVVIECDSLEFQQYIEVQDVPSVWKGIQRGRYTLRLLIPTKDPSVSVLAVVTRVGVRSTSQYLVEYEDLSGNHYVTIFPIGKRLFLIPKVWGSKPIDVLNPRRISCKL